MRLEGLLVDTYAPSRAEMRQWLEGPQIFIDGGRVLSWHNPAHPGYAYPEAAALWLSWSAWRAERGEEGPPTAAVERVAAGLLQDLWPQGSVGRGVDRYLFDTCLALHALARARRAGFNTPEAPFGHALGSLRRFLTADVPVLPLRARPERWSLRWGPFLGRGAMLLLQAACWAGRGDVAETARQIRARLGPPAPGASYTHALLYGAEGELMARALGEPAGRVDPDAIAAQIAELQRPDGALPAWEDGTGGPRMDCTAQGIRIWAAVAPARYAPQIRGALAALAGRQSPEGALTYDDGEDRNTWATLFAEQAVAWAEGGAEPLGWL